VGFLTLFFIFETTYLSLKEKNISQKKLFVKKIGLPDLAVSTEAKYIRHRSLSDIFSIFSEDPEGVSYFVTTFTYAPSTVLYNTPSKIEN
jgi:hypothetical protein